MRRVMFGVMALVGAGCGGEVMAPAVERAQAERAQVAVASRAEAPAPREDPLAPEVLMRDVRALAAPELRGRGSTTADEARAADWLAARMEAIGLAPFAGGRVFPFRVAPGQAARGITWGDTSRNVLGELVPPRTIDARVVVVGAHYDHDGVVNGVLHPGADDNATGVGAVLGVARALAAEPQRVGRRIVFVFFGAEEIGLLGAWALTRSGPLEMDRVAAMVNVDMIGRPLQDQPTFRFAQRMLGIDAEHSVGVAGLKDRPWLEAIVRGACEAEGQRAVTVEDLPERLQGMAETVSRARGDHFPFEHAGVPSVIFSSGESVDYHQPTDTTDTIRPDLLAARARVILRTVEALSTADIPPREVPAVTARSR